MNALSNTSNSEMITRPYVPLYLEEVDADELPEDDLDGLGDSDDTDAVSIDVPVLCPNCGHKTKFNLTTKVVH